MVDKDALQKILIEAHFKKEALYAKIAQLDDETEVLLSGLVSGDDIANARNIALLKNSIFSATPVTLGDRNSDYAVRKDGIDFRIEVTYKVLFDEIRKRPSA